MLLFYLYFQIKRFFILGVSFLCMANVEGKVGKMKIDRRIPPYGNMDKIRDKIQKAQNIVIITGGGISTPSGVPFFHGTGGFWREQLFERKHIPKKFEEFISLMWELNHYRREMVRQLKPNHAHLSIAAFEKRLQLEGRKVTVITQTIDGFHFDAGSKNVIEVHGSLFKTKCMNCSSIVENRDSPPCEALRGRGDPYVNPLPDIPEEQLPRCKQPGCRDLVIPYIFWYPDDFIPEVLVKCRKALAECDLCLVVGQIQHIYPIEHFYLQVIDRDVPIAEFATNHSDCTFYFQYFFKGDVTDLVPRALG